MATKTKKRERIGRPLSLMSLKELGYIHGNLNAIDEHQSTDGSEAYCFFVTRGYTLVPVKYVGKAYITQTLNSNEKTGMHVDYFFINENPKGKYPIYKAASDLICNNDLLKSLKSYQSNVEFTKPDGDPINSLAHTINAKVNNNHVRYKAGSLNYQKNLESPLTCDWSLFKAVQNSKLQKMPIPSFSVLEDSGIIRPNQKMMCRGPFEFKSDSGLKQVHCYIRLGTGILPVEYWLDNKSRLLSVISSALVCIYEPLVAKSLPDNIKSTIQKM